MPRLHIDLQKIEANTRLVAGLLAPVDVRLVGVTKACLGDYRVAAAMLAGGAQALADSRAASIAGLRNRFPDVELELLSPQSGGATLPETADLIFVSSAAQAEALLPLTAARPLSLCLFIETGDGREGVPPEELAAEAARIESLPGLALAGFATNAACAGEAPSPGKPLARFRKAVESLVRGASGPSNSSAMESFPGTLSAGGSGLLGLLTGNGKPEQCQESIGWLSELRCGEALLLGMIPRGGGVSSRLPGSHTDAFILEAPVVEVAGKRGRIQVLAGVGVQDMGAGKLTPIDPGLFVAHATSDYLGLTLEDSAPAPETGDRLAFVPDYYALLAAMTSPFVAKEFTGGHPYGEYGSAGGAYSTPAARGSEDSISEA